MESTINFIEVPVFRPNKKEFADFSSMINRIETDPRALAAGLAKVSIVANQLHNFSSKISIVFNVDFFQ